MDLDALRKQKQQRKQAEAVFRNRETLTKSSLFNKQDSTNEANRHFELGNCYFDGLKGYPEDERKAVYEYLKAAELGHTSAMKEVAYDYMDSSESALGYDLQKARAWGLKTVECHDMDGYLVLSEVEKELGNGYEAFKLLEKGADNKSRDCIEQLAYLYYWGSDIAGFNVGKDGERALKLLTSVQWDNDYCLAYELLGHIYWDQEKHFLAKEYYERALKADPELYGAMASLGTMLRSVDEVKDYRRAKELLLTASEAGNLTAMNEYGVMLYLGEDMEQDLLGAIEWFEKSAEGGNTQAMLNLGDVLLDEDPELARYWFNQAKEHGDNRGEERLNDLDEPSVIVDTSSVDKVYENFLNNLENTLDLSPSTILGSGFPNRIDGIRKMIDKGDLSDSDKDRLKVLQATLSLMYFRYHFLDDNFSEYEDEYFKIIDAIDDYVKSMSQISDEAAYIYFIANMYSADRYKDADPLDKLEELWNNISEIELDDNITEFKVSYWKDSAQEVYDLMSDLLSPTPSYNSSSSYSTLSRDVIEKKVKNIVAENLFVEVDDVHLYSRLVQDLGADSLDAVELVMEMEKEFNLVIPDEDAERIRTIGDIVSYISTHS